MGGKKSDEHKTKGGHGNDSFQCESSFTSEKVLNRSNGSVNTSFVLEKSCASTNGLVQAEHLSYKVTIV